MNRRICFENKKDHATSEQFLLATEEAKIKDRSIWKEIFTVQPEHLPPEYVNLISQVYCACANEITENKWFNNINSLKKILKNIKGEI